MKQWDGTARMGWLRDHSPLPQLVDARPSLRAWLDRAASLPPIQKTLPDRDAAIRAYLSKPAASASTR